MLISEQEMDRQWANLLNVHLLPIVANLRLKASRLLESYARPLRTCSDMFCEIWAMSLELKADET
jgi:hypothetical protein